MTFVEVKINQKANGEINNLKVHVSDSKETIRKTLIKIGAKYVVQPLNSNKLKNRDREVGVIKFIGTNDGIMVQVKFLDTGRVGRIQPEELVKL